MSLKELVLKAGRTSASMQTLRLRTYLTETGWVRSRVEDTPVDSKGRARPWLAMPAIRLLEERVPQDVRVFEWGSGASTTWWRARGATVVSCDHDAVWAAKTPGVLLRPVDAGYVDAIANEGAFDVVLIDGRRRVDCARIATQHLTERGIILLDNSERPRYEGAIDLLTAAGFRHLPIVGLAPGGLHEQQTSVFYRDGNLLRL